MSKNPKGPIQKEKPDLPKSPKQPYGEPLSGSHKDKMRNQGKERRQADSGM